MARRPLVFVLALTVGDYFLWNWSLNANHDVLALISGLTLPPLALAALWLIAMSAARLLARIAGRADEPAPAVRKRSRGYSAQAARDAAASGTMQGEAQPASRKIAA